VASRDEVHVLFRHPGEQGLMLSRPVPDVAAIAAAHGACGRGGRGVPDGQRRSWSLLVLLSVAQFMVILES